MSPDPTETPPACALRGGHCPRGCIGVCLLSLECPDCQAKDGAWCIRPSGHKAMDIHESRLRLADRIAIEQAPDQVRATLGDQGLRLWTRLLGMEGRCADPKVRGPGRICPLAKVRCEAAACVDLGCTADQDDSGQQILDLQ
jgi:hypothetical protein